MGKKSSKKAAARSPVFCTSSVPSKALVKEQEEAKVEAKAKVLVAPAAAAPVRAAVEASPLQVAGTAPRRRRGYPAALEASAAATEDVALVQDHTAELTRGLTLAGEPLQPPHLIETGWRRNQYFSERQDPDRVRFPWNPPSFVNLKDPAEQNAKTSVEDISVGRVGGSRRSFSFAKVVHGVMDEEDCAELLACVNSKGFTPALINVGGGNQMLRPDARDGHRVIVDSAPLAEWLLEVIRPHLPRVLDGAQLVDLNERCRFLCYTPGQFFAPHQDGQYTRPPQHKNSGDFSAITVQVYLHDVPKRNGGGTTFLSDTEEAVAACQPGAGDVLIFTQDLCHEGSLLEEGLKYTMRTEAMYRRL